MDSKKCFTLLTGSNAEPSHSKKKFKLYCVKTKNHTFGINSSDSDLVIP